MSINDVRKKIKEEEARRKGGSSSSSKPASASSGESISDRVARIKSESKLGEASGIQKNTNERIDYVNSGIYKPGVSRDMGMTAAGLAHLGKRAGDVINTLGIYGNRYGEAGKIAQEQAGVATSPAAKRAQAMARARSGDMNVLNGLDEDDPQYALYKRLLRLSGYDDVTRAYGATELPEDMQRDGLVTYEDLFNQQQGYSLNQLGRDLQDVEFLSQGAGNSQRYVDASGRIADYFGGDWSADAVNERMKAGGAGWYNDVLKQYGIDTDALLTAYPLDDKGHTYDGYVEYMQGLAKQKKADEEAQARYNEWKAGFDSKWGNLSQAEDYDSYVRQRYYPNQYGGGWSEDQQLYENIVYGLYTKTADDTDLLTQGTGYEEKGYHMMTPEERDAYAYLFNQRGADTANEYLADLQPELWRRRSIQNTQANAEWADKNAVNGVLGAIAARGGNLMNDVTGVLAGIHSAFGGKLDAYDPIFDYGRNAQTLDSVNSQNIREATQWANIGNVNPFQIAYGGLASAADSILAGGLFGATGGSLAQAAGAGSTALREGLESGKSYNDALMDAIATGAFEGLTEKFSMDALFKGGTSGVKNIVRNMLTEPSEEVANMLLNLGYDRLRYGTDDDLGRRMNELVTQGYTESEARVQMLKELGGEALETILTAVVAGGAGGTVSAASTHAENKGIGKQIQENETTARLLEIAEGMQDLPEDVRALIEDQKAAVQAAQEAQRAAETQDEEMVEEEPEAPEAAQEAVEEDAEEAAAEETTDTAEEVAPKKPDTKKKKTPQLNNAKLGRIYRETMSRLDEQAQALVEGNFAETSVRKALQRYAFLDTDSQGRVAQRDKPMQQLLEKVTSKAIYSAEKLTEQERSVLLGSKAAMRAVGEFTGIVPRDGDTERKRIRSAAEELYSLTQPKSKTAAEAVETSEAGAAAEPQDVSVSVEEASELTPAEAEQVVKEVASVYGSNADIVSGAYEQGQNVAEYATAFRAAYEYGQDGRNLENIKTSSALAVLNENQIRTAYELGRGVRRTATKPGQKQYRGVPVGNVDTSALKGMKLNGTQQKSVGAIRRLAEAVGFNIEFIASAPNAEGKYTTKNGSWNSSTRTMTVDINAGRISAGDANYAMMQTVGHELTHFIADFADSELFNDYQEFVFGHLSEKMDEDVLNDRIQKIIEGNAKQGKTLTREQAAIEVVADASGDALLSLTEADIRELAQTKPTLLQKIADYIQKWTKKVVELIRKAYDGQGRNQIAEQMVDVAEEMGRKWVTLLKNANTRAMEDTGELLVTTEQGATVSAEVANVMAGDGYAAPEIDDPLLDDESNQVRLTDAWAEAHRREYPDDENFDNNLALIHSLNERIMQDNVLRFLVPHGRTTKTSQGPLRNNIEYRRTFDMDTKCERTYQFLAYRDAIQKKIGRQLYEDEARNLIELMRAYGQMIPCTYCYVEGKRMRLAELYLRALKKSGSEVLGREISAEQMFDEVESARAIVSGWLDAQLNVPGNYRTDETTAVDGFEGYRDLELPITAEQATEQVCEAYGVTDKAAKKVIAGFVAEWVYNRRMDLPMQLAAEADYRTGTIDQAVLAFHDRAIKTAQGGAKAKGIENYEPYVDQLKSISLEDKRFINGMGGIRKHSSNDFQIQNVHDYMLFFMDLAADRRGGTGWYGHTYTKNASYARIFAPTNDRINVSIAMYGDDASGIRPNEQEGAVWTEVQQLRRRYKNVGAMAMAVNNDQLSYALNSEWIDMIIPFHSSGIPKKYWNNASLKWVDFTAKQSERLYNGTQMKKMLKERGISVPSSMKAAEVRQLFDETFGIKAVYDENGKRKAPHFYPYDTERYGVTIPGHGNSAERYFELCREYGVNPRFYGIEVKNAKGEMIPITEHPGYLKLIKETARTDTPQQEIVAKFDMAEIEKELKGFKGYGNLSEDAYGIVDEFVQQYVGKNRPMGYLTERAKNTRATIAEMAAEEQAKRDSQRERMLENIQRDGAAVHSEFMDDDDSVNQLRDPDLISDREILANIMESAAENADELDHVRRYRKRIATLNELQTQLDETNAALADARKRGAKKEQAALMEKANGIARKLDREDGMLLKYESGKLLQAVVKRQREQLRRELNRKASQRAQKRMKEVRQQDREHYEERIRQLRAEKNAKLDEMRREKTDAVAKVRAEKNESFAKAQYLGEVQKHAKRLMDMLTTPTNKAHVPEFLRRPLADFITALDFSSVTKLEGGADTKGDERLKDAMSDLATALRRVHNQQFGDQTTGAEFFGGYLDLPGDFLDTFDELMAKIRVSLKTSPAFAATPVNRMTSEQLHDLAKVFRLLHSSIANMNRLISNAKYASAVTAANDTMTDLEPLKDKRRHSELAGKVSSFLDWKNTVPYYVFKRFGRGGMAIFEGLMDGWDKLAHNSDELVKFTDKAYNVSEVREWEREVHTVELASGNTVSMTTAQMMSVYCLAKREQARGHLLGGGIRIADIGSRGKVIRQVANHLLTDADLKAIAKQLTPRQREVADALQNYMNTKGSEWGNYVSMKRFGYEMFTEEHYFPIETDPNNRAAQDEKSEGESLYRLLNMSATKGLTKGANNAIVVRSIFDVFTAHMTDMAKYNALGLQLLDTFKWFNYVERTQNKDGTVETRTTQKALEEAYGGDARSYIMQFLRDLNGVSEGGREDGFINKATSNYKIASTAANLRVGILQITSMPRAAYVINPKYLAVGLAKWNTGRGKNSAKAAEEVGIAKWKSMGFYDTNINRSVRKMVKHDENWREKAQDWSTKLAEWGDAWTMGVLYGAVEAEMKDKHPSVQPGSKAYRELFNRRMREIVYQTQVVDSTMTRSQLMRSKGLITLATSFMSEPTLAMNMLNDAIFEARMKARAGKAWFPAAAPKVARAFGTTTFVIGLSSVIEALFTAYRDDDEFETFAEKLTKAFFGESFWDGALGGNLNLLNNLPLIKDVIAAAQGDTSDAMYSAWAKTMYDGLKTLYTVMVEGGSDADIYRGVYKTVNGMSQLTGIAAGGAMRELVALYNTFVAEPYGWKRLQTYENTAKDAAKAIYAAALRGDADMVKFYRERTGMYGIDAEKISKALATLVEADLNAGNIDSATARRLLTGEAGKTADYAADLINDVEYEKATGLDFDNLRDDYAAGLLTESQVRSHLAKYGGLDPDEVEDKMSRYDYYIATDKTTTPPKYWRIAYAHETGGNYRKLAEDAIVDIIAGGRTEKQARRQIADSLESYYKAEYLAVEGTPAGDRMLEDILDVYEAIGFTRDYERNYIAENWFD